MSNKRNGRKPWAHAGSARADDAASPASSPVREDETMSTLDEPAADDAESVEEIAASVEAADEAQRDDTPATDAEGEDGTEAATADADAPAGGDAPDAQADADAEEDLDGEDSLTFSNGVIEKIVAIAMRDVPGVIGMKGGWLNRVQDVIGVSDSRKGVTVEVTPDASVRVNISVLIEYGAYAPQVFEDVKKAVVKNVTGMTGLSVAGVNLRIEDVLTADEVAARNKAEKVAEDKALAEAAVASVEADGTAE
jgi:uncharacterized alkaline shock family protein YloU